MRVIEQTHRPPLRLSALVNSAQAWHVDLALDSSRPAAMSPQAARPVIYVCTRLTNGHVTSTPHADVDAARSALRIFLSAALQIGYRIHPPEEARPTLGQPYLALREHSVLTFWLSEIDGARPTLFDATSRYVD
jgi:hypothetical protein